MNILPTDCFGGLSPRRDQVQAGATRLSYLEWGTGGAPLLLLHGITSSARSFWRVAPALVAQGYHVFALDMPGHGESEEIGDHRIEHIAGLAAQVIRALALDSPVLIGHSWGGATVLALASAGQPALKRVILIDPALSMAPERAERDLPRFLNGVGQPPEATLDAVRAANPDWHDCDVHWKGEALQQCRAEAVRGLFLSSGTWDFTRLPAQVDAPLLLLIADPQHTIIAPAALAAAEQVLRPGLGQLVTVPGTNHNMLRGGYDVTMPIMLEWLGHPETKRLEIGD